MAWFCNFCDVFITINSHVLKLKFSQKLTCEFRENKTTAKITTYKVQCYGLPNLNFHFYLHIPVLHLSFFFFFTLSPLPHFLYEYLVFSANWNHVFVDSCLCYHGNRYVHVAHVQDKFTLEYCDSLLNILLNFQNGDLGGKQKTKTLTNISIIYSNKHNDYCYDYDYYCIQYYYS